MIAQQLLNLLVNRNDTYTVQLNTGGYNRVSKPLTPDIIQQHLDGKITIGAYQLSPENKTKYTCWDMDPEKLQNPLSTAKKILSILLEVKNEADGTDRPRVWPFTVLLEASRYPDNSYHVWLLYSPDVPAKIAQWIGYRVLELAKLNPKEIEVFPKQSQLSPERPYGNFVKLPLGLHQVEKKYSSIIDKTTFDPQPNYELLLYHGASFSEKDIAEIMTFETKKGVQVGLNFTTRSPKDFKALDNAEEEKNVQFLLKYWVPGYRNDVQRYFLGMCIKNGVAKESAERIIKAVLDRNNTAQIDREKALDKIDYHYNNRLNINVKGKSGFFELLADPKFQAKAQAHRGGNA